MSPIVLATYRDYAETLRRVGMATPTRMQGVDQPYYYDLDLAQFLSLGTWDQLDGSRGGQVLARTTDVCISNGAATYLGLVAYTTLGHVPMTDQEAMTLANKIKPLLRAQGLPVFDPEIYFTPEGRQITPIIVMYEHQYLAYQLRFTERQGTLDHERVLLYPHAGFVTEPEFIALTDRGEELGTLLDGNSDLRRRATELGFRINEPKVNSRKPRVPTEEKVPEPPQASRTSAFLPDASRLEKIISIVGDCPPLP